MLANYGQTGMIWSHGEFTGDGTVDINDLTIVLAHYNQSVASSAPEWLPCPSRIDCRCCVLLGPGRPEPANEAGSRLGRDLKTITIQPNAVNRWGRSF